MTFLTDTRMEITSLDQPGLTLYPNDVSSPYIFPDLQIDITDVFAD